ncbi:hypothetical protein D6T65_01390 [Arthrobacter frigidicola]|nr:hypothetical protein D6T65_01390 [Arthrobacter frigidicola]
MPVRSWLTYPVKSIRTRRTAQAGAAGTTSGPGDPRSVQRVVALPAVVLVIAMANLIIESIDPLDPPQPLLLTVLQAALVVGQAAALLFRYRAPAPVFAIVVMLQTVLLVTGGADLGLGTLAVVVSAFYLIRWAPRPRAWYVLTALALASSAVVLGVALGGTQPPLLVFALIAGRLVFEFAAPALTAELVRNRAYLATAARERDEMIRREQVRDEAQRRRAEQTALARELHDISGHHLSGIIVTAQAAGTLIEKDPLRTRAMLRELEGEARAMMVDLRRTVGLLRPDPETEGATGDIRASIGTPGLGDLPELIDAAVRRGQSVTFESTGEASHLGPVAQATIYRVVQESLANAARHAPGAKCTVTIEYLPEATVLTVENTSSLHYRDIIYAQPTPVHDRASHGYGLVGMHERAKLIGAELTTGRTETGGWSNRLRIPNLVQGAP